VPTRSLSGLADRVARLMRDQGLVGVHRHRRRGLTTPDPAAHWKKIWSTNPWSG
jgi:hypothetical protein